MLHLFSRRVQNSSRTTRIAKRPSLHRRRLRMEALEARHLLAAVIWDGAGGDHLWSNPLNWSTNQLPGPSDDVTIDAPGNVTIQYDSSVQTTIGSLILADSIRLSSGSINVSGAFTINPGQTLTVAGAGVSFAAQGETTANGASFQVTAGALLLPNINSYTNIPGTRSIIRATGGSSVINLSNLQTISTGEGGTQWLDIEAINGGRIDLSGVTDILDTPTGGLGGRRITVTANGNNSRVDLSSLRTFQDRSVETSLGWDGTSAITAIEGGTIDAPLLENLSRVRLTLDGTATFPISQIASFTSGYMVLSGTNHTFASLNNLDGTDVRVATGTTSFPSLTSYINIPGIRSIIRATGGSSVINLSNLQTISTGEGGTQWLDIEAINGGRVDMSGVTDILDTPTGGLGGRRITVTANGNNSRVDLPSLRTFQDRSVETSLGWDGTSAITVIEGGTVDAPLLENLSRVRLTFDGTATFPISQIVSFTSGYMALSGTNHTFASLNNLDGTDVRVATGTTSFPSLTSYINVPGIRSIIRATGSSSAIDLSNLQTISTGEGGTQWLDIEAINGGRVDLSGVTDILDTPTGGLGGRRITVTANGNNSRVDLSSLRTFQDRSVETSLGWDGTSAITVIEGGTVDAPLLENLSRVRLTLDGTATFPISQIASFTSGYMVLSGTNHTFASLNSLDGTDVRVTSGTTSFPSLTSYINVPGIRSIIRATGSSSVIDLSNLQTISTGEGGTQWLDIEAINGGRVDLSGVTDILDTPTGGLGGRRITVTANGNNSRVDLSSLRTFQDRSVETSLGWDGTSAITVIEGGTVDAPLLENLSRVRLTLDGTATFSISQIASFTSGYMVLSGTNHTFASLNNLDGTDVQATSGTTSFPSLTSYINVPGIRSTIRATGSSSVIDLSNLQTISTGEGGTQWLDIEAINGGRVDLSGVTDILDTPTGGLGGRRITVTANGNNSRVDLSSLRTFQDRSVETSLGWDGTSAITVIEGGTVDAPLLENLSRVRLTLDGTATFAISQIVSFTSGYMVLSGTNHPFASLNNLDGTDVRVTSGTTSFPSLTSYINVLGIRSIIRATGSSSAIDLSNLQTISTGEGGTQWLDIEAINGGQVDLSGVTDILDTPTGGLGGRRITVTANGNNSRVDLSSLRTFQDRSVVTSLGWDGTSAITALAGGTIYAPLLETISGTRLIVDGSGTFPVGQIERFTNGVIELNGSGFVFSQLNDITGTDIRVTSASVFMPEVANYVLVPGTNRVIRVTGDTATIDLRNLRTISTADGAQQHLAIEAIDGGNVNLSRVTEIADSLLGNLAGRRVTVNADGDGSRVDLSSLATFHDRSTDPSGGWNGVSALTATEGGTIVLSLATLLTNVDVNADEFSWIGPDDGLHVETLPLYVSTIGTLTRNGDLVAYEIKVLESTPLLLTLDHSRNNDHTEVYIRRGALPTRRAFDYRYSTASVADHSIIVPNASPGPWYVLVYGNHIPSPADFTILATTPSIVLGDLTPKAHGADHMVTVAITGSGFLTDSQATLIARNGVEISATSTFVNSYSQLSATFDLSGVAEGVYDLQVTAPSGVSDTLEAAFNVLEAGTAELETQLILPSVLGYHQTATLYVEYANTGTAAMQAPILTLQSADPNDADKPLLTLHQHNLTTGFWTSAMPDGFAHSVQIYASGASPGLLQPGERVRVPVYYAGLLQPWDFSNRAFEFEIRIHEAGSTEAIDWPSLQSELQPERIDSNAWEVIYGNLTEQIGGTWGDYVSMLSENAVYLDRFGYNMTDVNELYNFELLKAMGLSPIRTMASVIDASLPANGLPLELGRSFSNSITERNRLGLFGYGWTASWYNASLETTTDGTVVIQTFAESQRRFQPDMRQNGAFLSQSGDTGTLRQINGGAYELKESSGVITRFHANGKLDYLQDTNGNRITAGYTGEQLTSLIHSNGSSLILDYNAAGRISSIGDSAGRTTTYSYDATNTHLLSVSSPSGTTSYTYSIGNGVAREHALLSITDASGIARHFEYNTRGHLSATFVADNVERIDLTYDSSGKVTMTDSLGLTTTLFYDHRGLIVRDEDSLGVFTLYEYNNARQLVRETNVIGQSRLYNWSTSGYLTSVTDEYGQATRFTYSGPNNRLASFKDANGNTNWYSYDSNGNLTETTFADGSIEQIAFNALGNAIELTNRRGQAIGMERNTAGQITLETFPGGSSNVYAYDDRGRLISAESSPHGITAFTFDSADRLIRVDYPNERWLEYTYDAAGRRIRMEDHDGFVVQYTYDSAGRLSELRDGDDALVVAYTYDVGGRLIREDKGNGTYSLYGYDAAGRTESIHHHAPGGSVNSRFIYSYDTLGRRVGMETIDGTWSYTYDLIGQLTRAAFKSINPEIASQDLNYVYDALGNRVQTILNGIITEYVTNNLNQYVSAGDTTFEYDLDGNLVLEVSPSGIRQYTYDARNRLVRAETPDGVWEYEYDAFGNRTARVTNGERSEFMLDITGLVSVIGEFDGSGSRAASYAHGLGLEAASRDDDWHYYDYNAIGSTAHITSADGNLANSYSYDPLGNLLQQTQTVSNPFQFVGMLGVATEGNQLQFMRARFYDASIGRFIAIDPIGLDGHDFNFYRYVENNALGLIDPTGHSACGHTVNVICGAVGVAVGMGGTAAGITAPAGWGAGFAISTVCGAYGIVICKPIDSDEPRPKPSDPKGESGGGSGGVGGESGGAGGGSGGAGGGPGSAPPGSADSPNPPGGSGGEGASGAAQAVDPNEKFGAAGYGPQAFVLPGITIPYVIHFENLGPGSDPVPDNPATAPAQRVEITDQLSENLDWSTFQFSGGGFGDVHFSVPTELHHYFTVIPMTYNDKTFDVEVEFSFDVIAGDLRVVFQSIDPETTLPPDVLTGFLPPEDGTGIGQGYINFTVKAKSDLPSGTEIRNVAYITFDFQEVIATNQINPQDASQGFDPNKEALNTIDVAPPTSSVEALPSTVGDNFTVSWGGEDDQQGSGINWFDVYVSINEGPFESWLVRTVDSSAVFNGQLGNHYAFYSIATDNVGHRENKEATAEATTFVGSPWQNPIERWDVDANGNTEPLDALLILNHLTRTRRDPTYSAPEPHQKPYFDVNGDGQITVLDSLHVLNELRLRAQERGGPAGETQSLMAPVPPMFAPPIVVHSIPVVDGKVVEPLEMPLQAVPEAEQLFDVDVVEQIGFSADRLANEVAARRAAASKTASDEFDWADFDSVDELELELLGQNHE